MNRHDIRDPRSQTQDPIFSPDQQRSANPKSRWCSPKSAAKSFPWIPCRSIAAWTRQRQTVRRRTRPRAASPDRRRGFERTLRRGQVCRTRAPGRGGNSTRDRVPIFCGGTGLYFKAFLDGLGDAPPSDEKLRAELEAAPLADLLHELQECDPKTFEKIDRRNPRRVIRAVEVIRLTGKPFSAQRARWGELLERRRLAGLFLTARKRHLPATPALPVCTSLIARHPPNSFCFTRPSADLHARINARVEAMLTRDCGRNADCSATASHKTKPPCKPSAIGRSPNICAANVRCRDDRTGEDQTRHTPGGS